MVNGWENFTDWQWAIVAIVLLIVVIEAAVDLDQPWGGLF